MYDSKKFFSDYYIPKNTPRVNQHSDQHSDSLLIVFPLRFKMLSEEFFSLPLL